MKLTASDLRKLGTYGVGGAVLATALELGRIYTGRKVPNSLSIQTEQVQNHPDVMMLLSQMDQLHLNKRQRVSFAKAVDSIDRILHIRNACKDSLEIPEDTSEFLFLQFCRSKKYCSFLVNNAMVCQPLDHIVQLKDLVKKLTSCVELIFYETYKSTTSNG